MKKKLPAIRYPDIDVAELRRSFGLSMEEFAGRFGFTLDSIKKWESGISQPYKTARTLLGIIATKPEIIDDVLRPPKGSSSRHEQDVFALGAQSRKRSALASKRF